MLRKADIIFILTVDEDKVEDENTTGIMWHRGEQAAYFPILLLHGQRDFAPTIMKISRVTNVDEAFW